MTTQKDRRMRLTPAIAIAIVVSLFLAATSANVGFASVSDPAVKCRLEVDRNVLPALKAQRAVVKVTLAASKPPKTSKRPPVNLSIALDRSSSMSGGKIEKAKEAAMEALGRLGHRDRFSLVAYSHTVDTVVPANSPLETSWIKSMIREIQPGGFTALFAGVSQAASEVRKNAHGEFVNRIILLSDGLANRGPSSAEELGRLGAALLKEGISVTTVGVGTDYNEDLMTRLSRRSDGNAYFVESFSDLPRIFSAELGDVLSVVAKKVRVIIECPDDIKPIGILGREGRIRGRSAELYLNQLYGGQEKYVLLEVEIPAQKDGGSISLASAKISYENAATSDDETVSGAVSAAFSEDKDKVAGSLNQDVFQEYQLYRNSMAQEEAISYADKGDRKKALKTLNQAARDLREAGRKYNNEELLNKAKQMEQQAVRVRDKGMTSVIRKFLKTDSFQTQNQQMSR